MKQGTFQQIAVMQDLQYASGHKLNRRRKWGKAGCTCMQQKTSFIIISNICRQGAVYVWCSCNLFNIQEVCKTGHLFSWTQTSRRFMYFASGVSWLVLSPHVKVSCNPFCACSFNVTAFIHNTTQIFLKIVHTWAHAASCSWIFQE